MARRCCGAQASRRQTRARCANGLRCALSEAPMRTRSAALRLCATRRGRSACHARSGWAPAQAVRTLGYAGTRVPPNPSLSYSPKGFVLTAVRAALRIDGSCLRHCAGGDVQVLRARVLLPKHQHQPPREGTHERLRFGGSFRSDRRARSCRGFGVHRRLQLAHERGGRVD